MDPLQILRSSKRILLVDWPDKSLPLALLNVGFEAFSYSPDKYSKAVKEDESVVFNKIEAKPAAIDIVNVFRPESELEGIIIHHALPLGAKIVWLHPPVTSEQAGELESKYQVTIIQSENIADLATKL